MPVRIFSEPFGWIWRDANGFEKKRHERISSEKIGGREYGFPFEFNK